MKLFHALFLSIIFLFSTATFADKININHATAEQIAIAMIGVGENKAKAIVEYRSRHGKFKMLQDLEHVVGIGSKTIEKNKDKITL